ncbi:MAG: DNA mismatch repair endonuclease MutL [Candidatus Heimdallarchaeota archaeon]|nr:DNA mismatch repair endonuclease MutL [Candidatus Heimdallarchaeota archaeon]
MGAEDKTIVTLDQKTINKIAAGEVVERPASVVKELVENSLDAGATEINITVEGYGLDLIKVVDNGIGMSPQDAELAWKPHTTSKLRTVEDLDSIHSLGFRGEALASIAAVAMIELITRQKNQPTGIRLQVKGGKLIQKEEWDGAPGTIVSVRNLFYNVPARKKFLKSSSTELGHIIEFVTRQALIHPEVHFRLRHNKSELLNSPGSDNPLEPFISIFGVELAKKMLKVDYQQGEVAVSGFTSLPAESRSSRSHEMIYVNKRYIKSQVISEAIEEAYKTLLMKNRFPVALINIKVDTSKVDVNIHPTKREVRFDNVSQVFKVVKEAIVKALESGDLWRESKGLIKETPKTPAKIEQAIFTLRPENGTVTTSEQKLPSEREAEDLTQQFPEAAPLEGDLQTNAQLNFEQPQNDSLSVSVDGSDKQVTARLRSNSSVIKLSDAFWIRPIGQVLKLYILCETNEGIAIVDLHATHERIRYERLSTAYKASQIAAQELLAPLSIRLSAAQAAFLKDHLADLEKIGFVAEFFGGNTFLVRKLPVTMDIMMTEADVNDFIDEVRKEVVKLDDLNDRIDLMLKTMACHSAIRGGDVVNLEKMVQVLTELSKCKKPFTCPHGRPTILKIPKKDLEKHFGRVV